MKAHLAILLLALSSTTAVAGPPQPSTDLSAVNAIKQLEQDMGDAMVRVDLAKLGEIYADDFASVGSSGKVYTKKDLMADFQSAHNKLESFENGPITVEVFGNVAVAYGSVSETRRRGDKDVSGNYVWMDLLENHNGKWVVLRSAGAKVNPQPPKRVSEAKGAVTSEDCSQRPLRPHLLAWI
jgi:ketosteroid isomerase-like protein